jgi:hypothetical protein
MINPRQAAEALQNLILAAVVIVVVMLIVSVMGCAHLPAATPDQDRVHFEANPFEPGTVARKVGSRWQILPPPELRFTGETAKGSEIQAWAWQHGITAVGVYGDAQYAQLESRSAIEMAMWAKALLDDIGYDYRLDIRDCEQFSKVIRAFPDLFDDTTDRPAQPLVFGIYAMLAEPFAGVSDGYHALNVAWTDRGVPVFEPQGRDLYHQDIRAWPSREGITHFQTE